MVGPGSSSAFLRWAASAGLALGLAVPALSAAVPADGFAQSAGMAALTLAAPPPAQPHQQAVTGGASESGLRLALQSATWPGDLVRLADEYLQQYAHRPWAADAVDIRRRAAVTAQLLRGDEVQLFRSAFALPSDRGHAPDDLRRAALGDGFAAFRLARQLQGAEGANPSRVGWLQLASELGNERAAYELALHFRRQSQPLLASRYEQRAIELGFPMLPALDHARK